MAHSGETEARKRAFFSHLYGLDSEDESLDENMAASSSFIRSWVKMNSLLDRENLPGKAAAEPSAAQARRSTVTGVPATPLRKLLRSATVPTSSAAKANPHQATVTENTRILTAADLLPLELRNPVRPELNAFVNASAAVEAPIARMGLGKRKRGEPVHLVPEEQRVFKNLVFYFFPNNNIDRARRARIEKASEYGAVWVKDWSENVTHVVVDSTLNYQDVLKYTGLLSVPANIAIVNEKYPADCITHRCLVDVKNAAYEVPGVIVKAGSAEAAPSQDRSSNTSLPLKPPKGDVVVLHPQTPSRTEESADFEQRESTSADGHSGRFNVPSLAKTNTLDEMIDQARAIEHLPLDLDDEDFSTPGSAELPVSDNEEEAPKPSGHGRSRNPAWQDKFQCMGKNDGSLSSDNPNARVIHILQEMERDYERTQDSWRSIAYRKAIASLRKHPRTVSTKEEAMALPFVGARLAAKIEEIFVTSRLRRLEATHLDPADHLLQTFANIYGVGYQQASKWAAQGHQTLADLLAHVSLSDNQQVGIAHYEDFLARIPRAEVAQHGAIVRQALRQIDTAFQVIVGGSYRRGASDSGDIDLIITKPNTSIEQIRPLILEAAIPLLFKQNFLRVGLAEAHHDKGSGTKWHGASCLPGATVWRRIDLLLVPWDEMGAALIYFTGNDIFNRSIRLLASKKGMRLNQKGLYKDVIRGKNRERITEGTLVEGRSEKRIFEILGVPWRPPEHRNC